ncbi:MAG: hypothetical protein PHH40_04640 [Candidatus Moranbacteria bacterium]|nr:hypothetical protein [Candidatus Moranbacteria bacterium]MDD3964477.1 hypothetical protein [Candidatus Moranbacteria bacterium]
MPIGEQYKPTILPTEADQTQEKTKDVDDGGPEFRPRIAEKLLRFLNMSRNIEAFQGKNAEEVFDNEESRRQFVLNLSLEEYIELLIGINGILRNKNRDAWGLDGKEVAIVGSHGVVWDFPEFEDKPILLEQSLQAAKKMIQENRSLTDVALLLSSTTSALHLFNDGNGRMSKFLLTLVNKGYSKDKQEIFADVLSSNGFSNAVNTGLLQPMIIALMGKEIGMYSDDENDFDFRDAKGNRPHDDIDSGNLNFNEGVSSEQQIFFKKKLKDSFVHMSQAIFIYFRENKYKYVVNDSLWIDLNLITPDLTNESIDGIIALWKQLKRRHVELIIDCIANPNKEDYQVEVSSRGGVTKTQPVLDMYKDDIKSNTKASIYKKVFE